MRIVIKKAFLDYYNGEKFIGKPKEIIEVDSKRAKELIADGRAEAIPEVENPVLKKRNAKKK